MTSARLGLLGCALGLLGCSPEAASVELVPPPPRESAAAVPSAGRAREDVGESELVAAGSSSPGSAALVPSAAVEHAGGVAAGGASADQPAPVVASAAARPSADVLVDDAVARGEALNAYVTETPRCAAGASHCFAIALHLVIVERAQGRAPVQTVSWVAAQVRQAQRLFASIDVSVQVESVDALPASILEIDTRSERDALGRGRFSRGVLDVFVVQRLADVDIDGEQIRGVHWRYRPETKRRWIILSRIASDLVLSHEMGHFFGLRHSTYKVSIMNKTPRDDPPWSSRVFAEPELARMRMHRDRMISSGMLIDHAR